MSKTIEIFRCINSVKLEKNNEMYDFFNLCQTPNEVIYNTLAKYYLNEYIKTDKNGNIALFYAIKSYNNFIFDDVLSKSNALHTNKNGVNALMIAVYFGYKYAIDKLYNLYPILAEMSDINKNISKDYILFS